MECDFYSRCVALQNGSTICECPEICTSLYQPICGSDNETYSNLCEMMVTSCTKQELITKDYDGECSMPIGMFKLCDLSSTIRILEFRTDSYPV